MELKLTPQRCYLFHSLSLGQESGKIGNVTTLKVYLLEPF